MPYQTEERLKSYLDTNQLHREQLCRAILAADKRFSDVRPRHPRGGPDGGRDMEAIFRGDQTAYGAVGFVNQANDSSEQKRTISSKFSSDLESASNANKKPDVFVFFTNVNLTIGEKESLVAQAKKRDLKYCEIFDRERLRIALDNPDGFATRYQYLNIPLSEEEQASFFARWGDDIQSIISTGFQRVESTLNRILFFQEAGDPLRYLSLSFELDRKYSSDEIGHFRLFCSMYLRESRLNILNMLFGSSDKSNRMRNDVDVDFTNQLPGIKHGISGGQWEAREDYDAVDHNQSQDEEDERYKQVCSLSSIGRDEVEFLHISYSTENYILIRPALSISLRDFDEAVFVLMLNKSLAEKVHAIHIVSNGYKIQEISPEDFRIDTTEFAPGIPVTFTSDELEDPWVRIFPSDMDAAFRIRFFEQTPKRLFAPKEVIDSFEGRRK